MTLLVRFVLEPEVWRKAMMKRDEGESAVPLIALRAFTPTVREGAKISLYRLEERADAASLAASFWLLKKEKFTLVAVCEDELKAAGAKLETLEGETYHAQVNPTHVDLDVPGVEEAYSYAKLFFEKGEILHVEPDAIRHSIANDNARELIDFVKLAKTSNQNQLAQLGDLIGRKTLTVSTPPKGGLG